jgi:hypothetical protein
MWVGLARVCTWPQSLPSPSEWAAVVAGDSNGQALALGSGEGRARSPTSGGILWVEFDSPQKGEIKPSISIIRNVTWFGNGVCTEGDQVKMILG